jgi:phage shock protein E
MSRRGMVSVALLIPVAVLAGTANAAGPAFPGPPVAVPGGVYTNVSPAGLRQMLAGKDFAFINVHVPYEGEIRGTDVHIPYDRIEARIRELPKDRMAPIVLYCRSGAMSATAAETLVRLGYTRVFNLEGGFLAWQQAGYPVKR